MQDVLSTPTVFPPDAQRHKTETRHFSNFSIEPLQQQQQEGFYGWHAVIWDAVCPEQTPVVQETAGLLDSKHISSLNICPSPPPV